MDSSDSVAKFMSKFPLFIFFTLPFLLPAGFVVAAAARPNVVVILTDDQGWGDLSVNGNTNLSTPHIDSLARDGAHVRPLLRLPGLLADAGRVPHRPLSPARRRARRLDRRRAARPRREDDRRRVQGRRLRHRLRSASGTTARSSRTTPTAAASTNTTASLRPLGRVLRPAARPQRQARAAARATSPTTSPTARSTFIEQNSDAAVLLLPAVQHAALADAGAGRFWDRFEDKPS